MCVLLLCNLLSTNSDKSLEDKTFFTIFAVKLTLTLKH